MSNFPKLTPAFTLQIVLQPPAPVGAVARGQSLVHVAFLPDAGFLRSEPDYPIKVDAVALHGADYIRGDPDGANLRLNVDGLLRDSATDALIRLNYTGIIDTAGEMGKVLAGAPGAKTTPFGEAFTHVMFETSNSQLKALEHKVYVGAGRFIVEQGAPLIVEYKISEVTL